MAEELWQDEQRLIHGLCAHDPLSLEALIQQYSRELFYFTRLILAGAGSAQDAEECLNDLFVTVWQEFDAFDPARGSLRTWLMMRAKYIALDCRRQLLRRQRSALPIVAPHEDYMLAQDQRSLESLEHLQGGQRHLTTAGVDVLLEWQEHLEVLHHALEDLPSFDRCIVYLRYFQDASIKELAARTSLTKHAVEARLWRARKVLRAALEEQMSGHSVKQIPFRAGRRASPAKGGMTTLMKMARAEGLDGLLA
jgi:RNA polymerase sigma factor (sigma-70 family)